MLKKAQTSSCSKSLGQDNRTSAHRAQEEKPNALFLNRPKKRYGFRSFARISKVNWFSLSLLSLSFSTSQPTPRLGNALTKCWHAVVRRLMMQMMSGAGSSSPATTDSTIDGEHAGVQQYCYGGRAMLGGQWLENTNSAAYPHARFLDSCVTKQEPSLPETIKIGGRSLWKEVNPLWSIRLRATVKGAEKRFSTP